MSKPDTSRQRPTHSPSELIGRVANMEEARSRHIDFLKNFPGIIYQSRIDWTPVFFVGAVEELTGHTPVEMTTGAVAWPNLVHQDDIAVLMNEDEKRLHDTPGHSITREYRIVRRDGTVRWVRESIRNSTNSSGAIDLFEGVLFDITELKTAQAALAESEATLRSIFRAAPVGIGTVVERVFTQVNDRFCEMTGYAREEVVGRNARMLYPTLQDYEYVGTEKYRQIRESGTGTVETKWKRKDGRTIDVLLSSTPLRPGDISAGVTFTATDLTEIKRSKLALDAEENRYRSLVDSLIEGLAVIDPSENIVFANRAFARILGHQEPDEVVGKNLSTYSTPEQLEAYSNQTTNRQAVRSSNTYEADILRPSGERRNVVIYASPLTGKGGEFRGTQGLIIDVTEKLRAEKEKERLEAQVRHSQKLESLGVLAGGIAHDFNNILLTILGNAELVLDESVVGGKSRPRLEAIKKAAQRAADLCRQMLAYSGRGRFEVRVLDLTAQVEEMGHILDVSVSKKSRIHYELEIGLPKIEADPGQISQIIMNLLTNASEAMEGRPGKITVRTGTVACDETRPGDCWPVPPAEMGEYVFLEVEDEGVGISKESLDKIFDPFYSTKFTGRGLGLSAVLGIVRGHGGAIKVTSAVGKGSAFKVLFRAAADRPEDARPARRRKSEEIPAGKPAKTGKILLVDDEETIRIVGESLLEMLGFESILAKDGAEAVDAFRKDYAGITAVILDLTMPEMDGREACSEILKIKPDASVIIASGYSDPEIERELIGNGAAGYLRKPYQISELKNCLRKVLG